MRHVRQQTTAPHHSDRDAVLPQLCKRAGPAAEPVTEVADALLIAIEFSREYEPAIWFAAVACFLMAL